MTDSSKRVSIRVDYDFFTRRTIGLFVVFASMLVPLGVHLVDAGPLAGHLWLAYPLGAGGVALGLVIWTHAAVRDYGPRSMGVMGFAALIGVVVFTNSVHSMFDKGLIPTPAYLSMLVALGLVAAFTLAFLTDRIVGEMIAANAAGEKATGFGWRIAMVGLAWGLSFWPGLDDTFGSLTQSITSTFK